MRPGRAACAPTIDALRKIRDAMPTDPTCDPSIRVRVVIAPFPKLDVPVAAVAWGITYKADCVDVPTLTQFAKDNYARAPRTSAPRARRSRSTDARTLAGSAGSGAYASS